MEQKEQTHKRRVRYKGTIQELIKKNIRNCSRRNTERRFRRVIRKGGTPAGMHISICATGNFRFSTDTTRTDWIRCYFRIWGTFF